MSRANEVKRILNPIISKLNRIEMDGDYLNWKCTVDTDLEFVTLTDNGTYDVHLRTDDLKIGGPDDRDENDSLLESNLRSNFEKLLRKHSKDLVIADTFWSEKGTWGFYMSFKSDKKTQASLKKIKILTTELNQYKNELTEFNDKIHKRIVEQKSKKKTCGHCDSNVSVSFFKSHKCPVCNTPMYTSTDTKRFENLSKRIKDRESQINKLRK